MQPPKIPSFFKFGKTSGPKRFMYSPRYYDEQKEKLDERMKRMQITEQELAALPEDVRKEVMREKMRQNWDRRSLAPNTGFSVKRFLIIIVVICLGLYYMYVKLLG